MVPGCGRRPPPMRPSTPRPARRHERGNAFAALGSLHPQQARAVPQPRGQPARPRRRDGAAQRARRVHAAHGGREHLGRPLGADHRVIPRREGLVLRPGVRQGIPASHVLLDTEGSAAAVTLVVAGAAAVYTLRMADDCLVLSHRLAQWSSWAPALEDDLALTNIALDLLGQARGMYARIAELDGTGRSEDDYAFLRGERAFVNCQLVEQENGDFATTMVRQLLCSTYQLAQWQALTASTDAQV